MAIAVTRTSTLTGITRTRELDITSRQYFDWMYGTLAQDAFPNLDTWEREFIMTGITEEEWDKYLGPEEDEV